MEGHPIKCLKNQTLEDFEQDFLRHEKPCVKLVNKR